MKKAKDRKQHKKQVIKRNKSMKTEKRRQRTIDNGHIRTHFKNLEPDLRFKLIDGQIHTYIKEKDDESVKIVPLVLPEDEYAGAEELAKHEGSWARLAEKEEELRRQDHERASRPRRAIKIVKKKSMFNTLKDKFLP